MTALLNLCLIYLKIIRALAKLSQHMPKKFEVNQTKIKGSCQSETKTAELISTSELYLVCSKLKIFDIWYTVLCYNDLGCFAKINYVQQQERARAHVQRRLLKPQNWSSWISKLLGILPKTNVFNQIREFFPRYTDKFMEIMIFYMQQMTPSPFFSISCKIQLCEIYHKIFRRHFW